MTTTLHRTIKGRPYTFTPNSRGWRVVAVEDNQSRFYRSYQVYTTYQGKPITCTCPNRVNAQKWCKHLQEAMSIHEEQQTMPPLSAKLAKGKKTVIATAKPVKKKDPLPDNDVNSKPIANQTDWRDTGDQRQPTPKPDQIPRQSIKPGKQAKKKDSHPSVPSSAGPTRVITAEVREYPWYNAVFKKQPTVKLFVRKVWVSPDIAALLEMDDNFKIRVWNGRSWIRWYSRAAARDQLILGDEVPAEEQAQLDAKYAQVLNS